MLEQFAMDHLAFLHSDVVLPITLNTRRGCYPNSCSNASDSEDDKMLS